MPNPERDGSPDQDANDSTPSHETRPFTSTGKFELVPAGGLPLSKLGETPGALTGPTSLVPYCDGEGEPSTLLKSWNCSRRTRAALEYYEQILNGLAATSTERLKDDVLFVCTYLVAVLVTTRMIRRDRDMSHDAAVDAVLRVRRKYDPSWGVPLQPFTALHARYSALRHCRRAQRCNEVFVDYDLNAVPDPRKCKPVALPAYFEASVQAAWADALKTLPKSEQDVVGPRIDHGLSFKVIAKGLGIEEVAARQRAYRARERLRENNALQALVAALIAHAG